MSKCELHFFLTRRKKKMDSLQGTFFESKRSVVQLWALVVVAALVDTIAPQLFEPAEGSSR